MVPDRLRASAANPAVMGAGLMFFLLRMAFWLGVVLVLLPSVTTTQQSTAGGEVRAAEAISAASATVEDLRGFCGRQPEACTVGSQMATAIGYKAQAGAKMLYDVLSEAMSSHETSPHETAPRETGALASGTGARGGSVKPAPDRAASQNTLTSGDLVPSWRGPTTRKDNPRKDGRHAA